MVLFHPRLADQIGGLTPAEAQKQDNEANLEGEGGTSRLTIELPSGFSSVSNSCRRAPPAIRLRRAHSRQEAGSGPFAEVLRRAHQGHRQDAEPVPRSPRKARIGRISEAVLRATDITVCSKMSMSARPASG